MCGQQALVYDSLSGLSVTVSIVDICDYCGRRDIALSPSAFEQLRNTAKGNFNVEWNTVELNDKK